VTNFLAKNDLESARVSVHTVKGVSANLGYGILQQASIELETSLKENKPMEVIQENLVKYKIEKVYFDKIKSGGRVTLDSGKVIENNLLSLPPDVPKSYAFCSDTLYDESIIPYIKGVDVLYHEATFLESEAHFTQKTKHATAKEAAQIAKLANVKQLMLGH
jgi:ribonuclease BN (tRNA processing enzyme)